MRSTIFGRLAQKKPRRAGQDGHRSHRGRVNASRPATPGRLRRKVRAGQPCRGYTAPASATPAIARCSPRSTALRRACRRVAYGTQSPLSLLAPVDAGASRRIFAPGSVHVFIVNWRGAHSTKVRGGATAGSFFFGCCIGERLLTTIGDLIEQHQIHFGCVSNDVALLIKRASAASELSVSLVRPCSPAASSCFNRRTSSSVKLIAIRRSASASQTLPQSPRL